MWASRTLSHFLGVQTQISYAVWQGWSRTSSLSSIPRGWGLVTTLRSQGGGAVGGGTVKADKSQFWGLGCAHRIHSPKDKGAVSGPNGTTRHHLLMMQPAPGQPPGLHHSPVKPGVRAASFLARASLLRLSSNLSGRRWTLKIDDLPLMSGGPERERERYRWPGQGHLQPLHQGQEDPLLLVCTAHSTTRPGPELPVAETTHRSHPFSSPFLTVGPLVRTTQSPGWLLWQQGTWAGMRS